MIKNGRIEKGKTPSEVSGKKSQVIKQGHALCSGEKAPEKDERDLKVPVDGNASALAASGE